MRLQHGLITVILLLCCTLVGALPKPSVTGQSRNGMQLSIARACNRIAIGVYQDVAVGVDNAVLSPFSMCSVLAVCFRSAKGSTLSELRDRMNLQLIDKREITATFGSILKSFQDDPNVNITSENIMSINKNFDVVEETAKDFITSYNGTLQTFDPDRESASSTINDLVSRSTNKMVEGDLKADDMSSDSGLILMNTVYLRAQWQDLFESGATNSLRFTFANGTETEVPTMHRRGRYRTNTNKKLKFDVIEIPYEGGRFAMYIVLPKERDGLGRLEKVLTPERSLRLEKSLEKMKKARTVDLYLPKFSIEHMFSMKQALQNSSINLLFDKDEADLSELIKGRKVFIKEAYHRSAIEVTEVGTIAGSYSMMVGHQYSFIPVFHARHPFMYIIRDIQTGFNLFMGKVSNP